MKKIIAISPFICIALFLCSYVGEWKKTEPVKGISFLLPREFVSMTDDDMAQEYPTFKKPLAMYNVPDKTVDFGVNTAVNRWNNKNLNIIRDIYKSTISSVFTNVNFIQDGVITKINNRDCILFEFISELKDDKRPDNRSYTIQNYSYIMYTLYQKKILIFNFNAPASKHSDIAPTAHKIISSIAVTDQLSLDDYVPVEVERPLPKGGKNDPQIEMIKKIRKQGAKKQE